MNALLVLYAPPNLTDCMEIIFNGKNSLEIALERSREFPSVCKTVLLAGSEGNLPVFEGVNIEKRASWTVKDLLETLTAHSEGFDLTYFAWADCPFLDPELAKRLADRHFRYAAEYSYADGWPYGIAPELLSPGTAAILAKILKDDDNGPVERDSLFSVIQKDINAFDIETEISSVDLRCHRLRLCADSKRNLLLLRRFAQDKVPDTAAIERVIAEKPEILRTLPAFYPIQVYGGCPQTCAFCPWSKAGGGITERRDFMEPGRFDSLLEKITAFSGDAVIDLSLWGELSLHPQKMELIEMVLRRPELDLIIETSGIGWKDDEIDKCAALAKTAGGRASSSGKNKFRLSWIVSLDTADPARYRELRGTGFAEANSLAKKLLTLFPKDAYVQAVRTAGAEDDIEKFYRSWKEITPNTSNIIIQKYDDFCGFLPRKQASDLSPVQRQPCWHLMRDMPVLIDGSVPLCREQIAGGGAINGGINIGNVFTEPGANAGADALEIIWERGQRFYTEQAGQMPGGKKYDSLCAGCDEYYTYNF
ncbi:MAG: spiro-SPASM protein [Treponema sp.]|jgi:spiro-SPASM protein|nr:spiro-SPASM protein [Treponema sp.]